MSIVDKLHALHGVKNYLSKKGFDTENEKELNVLFLAFAKSMGWEKDFSKPKKISLRRYNPALNNALLVQANFKDFKSYIQNLSK